MGTCFKSSIKSLSQPSSRLNLSGIMQVYFVLLLVAAASATPLNPATITKHNINNAPVLNLNHKNVHLTQQVPVVDTYTTLNQAVPQVYTTLNQVVPQVQNLVHTAVQTPVQVLTQQMPITQQYVKTVQTVAQTPVQLTPGYVAANQGAVHTAPLPEGPSKDGFFASHHINLPNQKA